MRAAILLLAIFSAQVSAHEIKVEISKQDAAVVRLSYADGNPFTFEAYEIYQPGKDIPEQVGRTNAQGQIVFLPGAQTEWRIKAYSADGHGIDQPLHVAPGGSAVSAGRSEMPRPLLLFAGLGIVFGIFGLIQLFFRRKPS
ncbi:MAG: ABC transporter permease [Sideroxydans sp.]|nr:ABC transporter permease [Sideroxydans sp.]